MQTLYRDRVLILLAAALPLVVLALFDPVGAPEADMGDYAQHLLHAEALAEGRPYTDTGYLYSPLAPWFSPLAQPPGLALLLAPVVAMGGTGGPLVPLVMMALAFLFFAAAGLHLFRLTGSAVLAAGAVAMAGLQAPLLHMASIPIPELAFAGATWLTVAVVDRTGAWTWGRVIAVTLLGGMAMLFRAPGGILVPALVLYAILHRRELGWRPALPALAWLAGFLALVLALPLADAIISILRFHPGQTFDTVLHNLRAYRFAVFNAHLYPFGGNVPDDLYHLVSSAVALIGLGYWLAAHTTRFLTIFAVVYVSALLVLPLTTTRYLWVLTPLIAFLLLDGIQQLAARFRRSARYATAIPGVISAGLVVTAIVGHATDVPPEPLAMHRDVQDVFRHLRSEESAREIRVAFFKPRVLRLETGIPSMPLLNTTPDRFMQELARQRITLAVVGDLGLDPVPSLRLRETVATFPDRFRRIYQNPSFTVYAVGLDSGGSPEAALRQVRP